MASPVRDDEAAAVRDRANTVLPSRSLTPTSRPKTKPPPRGSRFGSPLVLSRVHWYAPSSWPKSKYLTWTDDNLLRQVVYQGLREDKAAGDVRRAVPHPQPAAANRAGRRS